MEELLLVVEEEEEKSIPIIFSNSEKPVAGARELEGSVEEEEVEVRPGMPKEERLERLERLERSMPNADRSKPGMPAGAVADVVVWSVDDEGACDVEASVAGAED